MMYIRYVLNNIWTHFYLLNIPNKRKELIPNFQDFFHFSFILKGQYYKLSYILFYSYKQMCPLLNILLQFFFIKQLTTFLNMFGLHVCLLLLQYGPIISKSNFWYLFILDISSTFKVNNFTWCNFKKWTHLNNSHWAHYQRFVARWYKISSLAKNDWAWLNH